MEAPAVPLLCIDTAHDSSRPRSALPAQERMYAWSGAGRDRMRALTLTDSAAKRLCISRASLAA
eukprot:2368072-Rhodomonas_salina.12